MTREEIYLVRRFVYAVEPVCAGELVSADSLTDANRQSDAKGEGAKNAEEGGGRSIFQLALNKYLHAFQRARQRQAIYSHVCSYVPWCEHERGKG